MSYQTSIALVKYSLRLARAGPNIEARFRHAILGGHMNEIFSTDFSVIGEVFHSLVEFDKKYTIDSNLQRLLAVIFTIFEVRSRLACVCREWSALLSNTQTLSLCSLHLNAFGCHGTVIDILARYRALQSCHRLSCNLEVSLCRPTILKLLRLPWRLRVAKLDLYFRRTDNFSREMFGKEMDRVASTFSPQTIALVERAIAEFPSDARVLTRWPSTSQGNSQQTVFMQYELLNFQSGRQREVLADEFVAEFKNATVYSCRNLQHEDGTRWAVKVVTQLSSTLSLPSQSAHEVRGTSIFTFRQRSFEVVMRVSLSSRLKLILDFITIPNV